MMSVSNQAALGMLIRRLERIGQLSDAERHAVENLSAKVQTLRPRQDIVREGEKPEHSCLVVEGWAFRSSSSARAGARSCRSTCRATCRIYIVCISTRWITALRP